VLNGVESNLGKLHTAVCPKLHISTVNRELKCFYLTDIETWNQKELESISNIRNPNNT